MVDAALRVPCGWVLADVEADFAAGFRTLAAAETG